MSHDWTGLHYENNRREVQVDEEPYAATAEKATE